MFTKTHIYKSSTTKNIGTNAFHSNLSLHSNTNYNYCFHICKQSTGEFHAQHTLPECSSFTCTTGMCTIPKKVDMQYSSITTSYTRGAKMHGTEYHCMSISRIHVYTIKTRGYYTSGRFRWVSRFPWKPL